MSSEQTAVVYLGLGSNLGDRRFNLRQAVQLLLDLAAASRDGLAVASLYETSPVGDECATHPPYLNSVVRMKTALSPRDLLITIQRIEAQLGRLRIQPQEPRTIDIDILIYGQRLLNEPDLVIPHPRLLMRRFVLDPLLEIAADLVHPLSPEQIETAARHLRVSNPDQRVVCAENETWWHRSS